MRTAGLQPGDAVRANVRGRVFPARVVCLDDETIIGRPIRVEPLIGGITYRHLSARQLVERIEEPETAGERAAREAGELNAAHLAAIDGRDAERLDGVSTGVPADLDVDQERERERERARERMFDQSEGEQRRRR